MIKITEKEIGNHRISIYYDEYAPCPVKDWDMGARYLWEYSDSSRLNDSCNWKDWFSDNRRVTLEDAVRRIAVETVKPDAIVRYIKNGNVKRLRIVKDDEDWKLQEHGRGGVYYTLECYSSDEIEGYVGEILGYLEKGEVIALISECAEDFVIKEWSSRGYSQGDYVEGIAYVSKEYFDKYCGFNSHNYKTWQKQAEKIINCEVREIGMWLWGDVKGFVLEEKTPFTKVYKNGEVEEECFEWKEVDSCWGHYVDDADELIEEVIRQYNLKENVEL